MKRGNIILYLALLVVALYGLAYYFTASAPEAMIVVEVDGKKVAVYPLYAPDRDEYIDIQGINGITRIQLQDGRVRAIESACPDKICVNTGWISNSSLPIACLPNRVIIKIINAPTEDIDLR